MQVFMLSSFLFLASPVCKFVTRTVTPSDGVLTRNNSSLCHTMAHLPHNIGYIHIPTSHWCTSSFHLYT